MEMLVDFQFWCSVFRRMDRGARGACGALGGCWLNEEEEADWSGLFTIYALCALFGTSKKINLPLK